MKDCSENIYRIARLASGLTQIEAADAVLLSSRTIGDYESGKTAVPDDVLLRMVKAYNAPWLRLEHLKQNPVFMDVLGDVQSSKDVSSDVLKVFKELNDVVTIYPNMVEETVTHKTLSLPTLKECKEACRAMFTLIAGIKKEPSMLAHQRLVTKGRVKNG